MVLQSSGVPIKFSDLKTEFGGINRISFNDYYSDSSTRYTVYINTIPIKNSPISLFSFYGKAKFTVNGALNDSYIVNRNNLGYGQWFTGAQLLFASCIYGTKNNINTNYSYISGFKNGSYTIRFRGSISTFIARFFISKNYAPVNFSSSSIMDTVISATTPNSLYILAYTSSYALKTCDISVTVNLTTTDYIRCGLWNSTTARVETNKNYVDITLNYFIF